MLLSPSPHPLLRTKPPHISLRPPLSSKPPLITTISAAAKDSSGLSSSAIRRIADKLRSLGYVEDPTTPPTTTTTRSTTPFSPGEIFIPTPQTLPARRVGHTLDPSWSSPENPIPLPGADVARYSHLYKERSRPKAIPNAPSVAELTVPKGDLRRLRSEGIKLQKGIKIGKAGVTEGIVNGIHERWRLAELVKVRCEDLCRMNMKRTHETLERKTGGLVIWRSGSIIILYRGADYKYPYFYKENGENIKLGAMSSGPSMDEGPSADQNDRMIPAAGPATESRNALDDSSSVIGVGSPMKFRLQLSGERELEEEADKLLDGLGPRFTDWWGPDPLPIDADLLPAVVPGYRRPFRLLPFGVKPKLTDREMTILRRLGRPLPCHFALGRNRNLQGLAVSMIKLWERCEIAKIAVKRGVQNTNSEIMVEELKRLTGGTLLSRDKEFIVFYRGKDFLPPAVSLAIEERRSSGTAKLKKDGNIVFPISKKPHQKAEKPSSIDKHSVESGKTVKFPGEKRSSSRDFLINEVDIKLSEAIKKKEKAEKLLAELEGKVKKSATEPDKEGISQEERYMLRKVGLRMKPFLLLGRRGVFDGTVENMHLHWKYRELVKIICNERCLDNVEHAARTLEAESGGILVAVERVNKGHAIIVYRGKNYKRPTVLRPRTLLNKKEAMKRSLEAQRYESLKLHVLNISKNIDRLKQQKVINHGIIDPEESHEFVISYGAREASNESEEGNEDDSPNLTFGQEHFEHDSTSDQRPNLLNCEDVQPSFEQKKSIQSANLEVKDDFPEFEHVQSSSEQIQVQTSSDQESSIDLFGSLNKCHEIMMSPENEEISNLPSTGGTGASALSGHVPMSVSNEESPNFSLHPLQREAAISIHDTQKAMPDMKVPPKAAPISNRERLILRKQALRMRKRPVIAVGRSNILTGVAKTIMTHFRKHPLAIVNIKGRAKGTSVQEVIFELEQATGAVLVSREPNKVILYRGWGEGEAPEAVKQSDHGQSAEEAVPHQLMEAIRLECGLHHSYAEKSSK